MHLCQELGTVGGDAAGFGGDKAGAAHFCAVELGGADFQRLVRACHGGRRQLPRLPHALAQPDDPRERVDNAEAPARRTRQQQAAVVGAEVEGAVDGVAIARIGARLDAGGRLIVGRGVAAAAALRVCGTEMGDGLRGRGNPLGRGAGVGRVRRAAVVRVALQGLNSSAWHRVPEH